MMLKPARRTKGRKYPRKQYWIVQRNAAFARAGDKCEISGESLVSIRAGKKIYRRAAHHIICERCVRLYFKGADPHILENLLIITPAIHARITACEWRLFCGDLVGYKTELRRIGMTEEVFNRAWKALAHPQPKTVYT